MQEQEVEPILTPGLSTSKDVCFITVFYYCRTYYKAVRVGGGGEWRTCAMRDDEPRPVWMSLPITHCVCVKLCGLHVCCKYHNCFFKKKVTMAQAADTPPKSGSAQVRFAMVGVGCIGLEHIRNILLLPDAARSVKYSATMVLSGAALRCCAHVL